MISVQIDFTTKTVLGLSEASVSRCEYGEYDGRYMDNMVKWIMKAIKAENVRRPMITFSYWDDSRHRDVGTARIIVDYTDTEVLTWDDRGSLVSRVKGVKVDARLVKRLYTENVNRLNAVEGQAG